MGGTRKLAAILVADIVGYSRLAGADEDRILALLRTLRSELIDPTIAAHNGRVVKRTGDGAIVEFRSVVDAVRCAIDVQTGMAARNAGLPEDRRVAFRIGVHLGDVVEEDDGDLMGDGVNIAARIEGVAKPGGICLSEQAYWQVKGRLDLEIADLGATRLKNIAEPIRIYALDVGVPAAGKPAKGFAAAARPRPPWRNALAAAAVIIVIAAAGAWWSGLAPRMFGLSAMEDRLRNAPHLSIVVLPFANLSGDPEQDYFADGVTDDLTTDLSHILNSFVIARNTAFTYKGKSVDVKEIGRELGVRYALEGSVRRVGEAITVNAQLISTETGAHIWAERFEGERAKLGQLQVDVVAKIANALGAELAKAESLRALRERPDNPDAIDLAMKARQAGVRLGVAANKQAIDEYEQALKLDPNLTRAQEGLAFALASRTQLPGATDREADLDRAEKLADQALSAAPDNPSVLLAKAYVLGARKQTDAAILEAQAAIESDRNYATAYGDLAVWRALAGHAEQGFSDIETAIKLSPRDPLLPLWESYLCHLHMHLAEWDQVIAPCQRALAASPQYLVPHLDIAAAYAFLGRDAEAKAEVAEILKLNPGSTVKSLRSFAAIFSDNPVYTQQIARLAEGLRKAGLPEQ